MLQCTGALSTCNLVGFALESKCHTGQTIVYDAVGKLGWSVDIRTHRIGVIIERLLVPDWDKDSVKQASVKERPVFTQPTIIKQDHSGWFSWGWPWPRKGKRGENDEHDDEPAPDEPVDEPVEDDPSSPSEPPREKKPPKSHVPKPQIFSECRDCFKWDFFDDFGDGK